MPKLKHVAITTHDVERTAKFYVEVFGMKEMGKIDDPGTTGCFLSDGDINLAILDAADTIIQIVTYDHVSRVPRGQFIE